MRCSFFLFCQTKSPPPFVPSLKLSTHQFVTIRREDVFRIRFCRFSTCKFTKLPLLIKKLNFYETFSWGFLRNIFLWFLT